MWLYDRYRVWKLKYHRWRFDVQYAAEHKKLLEKHADNQDFASLEADEQFTLGEIQDQIDLIRSSNLFRKAYDYDVELPPSTDQSMWQSTDDGEKTFLSKKGRAYVRKLIHEEYGRDFDLRYGSFTRIILPLIGLLTGLIGASAPAVAASAAAEYPSLVNRLLIWVGTMVPRGFIGGMIALGREAPAMIQSGCSQLQ